MSSPEQMMAVFAEQYKLRTPKCAAFHAEASKYLSGGVAGRGKFLKPHPIYVKRSYGCRFTDLDDNEYLDMAMGSGACVLGHNLPAVSAAVKKQLDVATHPFFSTILEAELAKKIQQHMPHMELIRFANSGSEATRATIRIARAFTGRVKIAKFEGGFHGSDDSFLVSSMSPTVAGPDDAPDPVLDFAGIPPSVLDETVVLPFNKKDAALSILRRHGHEIAALILEPVAATPGGSVVVDLDFLRSLREEATKLGIILIMDEIVTGYRLGLGGAAVRFGVAPDLSAIGKGLACGIPIAAFGGKKEIMDAVVTPTGNESDHHTKIFHSGTFSGNPIAMAAGLAVIEEMERNDPFPRLDQIGDRVREGLRERFQSFGLPAQICGISSIFNFNFNPDPVVTRRDVLRSNNALQAAFCVGMIAHGVMQPIRHAVFLSYAHQDEDIQQYLDTAAHVLQIMENQGVLAPFRKKPVMVPA